VLQASVVLIRFSYTGEKGFYIEPDVFKDIFKKENNSQCGCNNYLNKIAAARIDIEKYFKHLLNRITECISE
jgi:hypothetical protein